MQYSKKSSEYTKTLTNAIEYFNVNDSLLILYSKVLFPFGKTAAIDNGTFRKLIRIQNEYLHKIRHIEVHNLCNIDKEISLGYDTTVELLNS
jgi:hypothetical protein